MSGEVLDEAGVLDKFGVRPDQIVDYLTLVGDTADNVPGVPKWGPKTAAKWLAEYSTLAALVADADAIKGVAGQNLRDTLGWLPMAKQLVTIKCDVNLEKELPQGVESLKPRATDWAALHVLFSRYAFKKWTEEAAAHLQREHERALQARCVAHDDHGVGLTAAHKVARDCLLRRVRTQGVCARNVHE